MAGSVRTKAFRSTVSDRHAPGEDAGFARTNTRVVVSTRGSAAAVLFLAASIGCGRREPPPATSRRRVAPTRPPRVRPAARAAARAPLPTTTRCRRRRISRRSGAPSRLSAGGERWWTPTPARARGLTVVDLSDDWAPSVLAPANPYRAVYTGARLGSRRRRRPAARRPASGTTSSSTASRRRCRCCAAASSRTARGTAPRPSTPTSCSPSTRSGPGARAPSRRSSASTARAGCGCEAARAAAGAPDLEALAERDARTARTSRSTCASRPSGSAFAEVEKRLVCEGLLDPRKHKPGAYDTAMRTAMLDFQQKHAVIDQADIKRATLEALARPPLDNDFLALRRVLTERACTPAASSRTGQRRATLATSDPAYPTYLGADGARHRVPDLATAAARRDARAASASRPPPTRSRSSAAIPPRTFAGSRSRSRLPPPPEYYGPAMELSAEIDRGDVWYELPVRRRRACASRSRASASRPSPST